MLSRADTPANAGYRPARLTLNSATCKSILIRAPGLLLLEQGDGLEGLSL
jgi:hypothetical protein